MPSEFTITGHARKPGEADARRQQGILDQVLPVFGPEQLTSSAFMANPSDVPGRAGDVWEIVLGGARHARDLAC